jgi:hypothetical protein
MIELTLIHSSDQIKIKLHGVAKLNFNLVAQD